MSPVTERPLVVLRIITTLEPEVGGPSYSAVNAAVAEQRAGVSTTIASTINARQPCYTPKALTSAGVRHTAFRRPRMLGGLGKRWGISVRYAIWIWRHAGRYDIVHVHYVWSLGTVMGVLAGKARDRPVVMTPHESLTSFDISRSRSPLRRIQKLVVRRVLLAGVDRVVTASRLERQDSDLDERQGSVIPHPVPHSDTTPAGGGDSGLGDYRIGFLGRLHPKKRIGDLIEALNDLPPRATLVVGGNQPRDEFSKLRRTLDTAGLDHRVRLLGFIPPDDREAFFASIDVLVMPSIYECFGMVAAEALSAGVPVIVTERTGIAEVVRQYNAGVIVPVRDPLAIAAAIHGILGSADGFAEMRENARLAAGSRLSFDAYAGAIRSVYDEIL